MFAERPQNEPRSLFLKICPDGHEFLVASEPSFHTHDYNSLLTRRIIDCFGTIRSPQMFCLPLQVCIPE